MFQHGTVRILQFHSAAYGNVFQSQPNILQKVH